MHLDLHESASTYNKWFEDQYEKIISDNIEELVKNVKPSEYYKYKDKVSSISLSENDLIIKYNNFLTYKIENIKNKLIEYAKRRLEIVHSEGWEVYDILMNNEDLYIDSYPTADESLIELLENTYDNSDLPELKALIYKQAIWQANCYISDFISGKGNKEENIVYTITNIEIIKTTEQLSNLWDFAKYLIHWNDEVIIHDTHIKNKKDFIIYLIKNEAIDIDINAQSILDQLLADQVINFDDIDIATAEILAEELDDRGD